jgi:hypothetical protein
MVLCYGFAGILQSLTTELSNGCHPLDVDRRCRMLKEFSYLAIRSMVSSISGIDWSHCDPGKEGVVVGILFQWQHLVPICLFVIVVLLEITFQCLVFTWCVSFRLWTKGQLNFGFDF